MFITKRFLPGFCLRFALVLTAVFLVCSSVDARRKERRSVVRLETTMGTIRIALMDETPVHRDNFLKLVSQGFYDATLFHRVIKDFMIQGGDPSSRTAPSGVLLGDGDVGYTLPPEFCLPDLYHKRGMVAAAREGDDVNPERRSSGCQFYIVWGRKMGPASLNKVRSSWEEKGYEYNHFMTDDYQMIGGTPHLDGEYTVFGEVIGGLDVVDRIQQEDTDSNDRPVQDVRIVKALVEQYSRNIHFR